MPDADVAQLEAFQAAMLVILGSDRDGERIKARLLADPASEPFRKWVESCEPRMLAVGAELVATWARRG